MRDGGESLVVEETEEDGQPSGHQEHSVAHTCTPALWKMWVEEVHVCSIAQSNQDRAAIKIAPWVDGVHVCSIAQSNQNQVHETLQENK